MLRVGVGPLPSGVTGGKFWTSRASKASPVKLWVIASALQGLIMTRVPWSLEQRQPPREPYRTRASVCKNAGGLSNNMSFRPPGLSKVGVIRTGKQSIRVPDGVQVCKTVQ